MLRSITIIAIILCAYLVATAEGMSQEIRFLARTNKSEVALGDYFIIEFSVNTSITEFTPPHFSDFQVLSGPNQSSSISIVNGAASYSYTYSYYLKPLKEGEYTIEGAKAKAGKNIITSNSVKIKVVKSSTSVRQSSPSSGMPQDETPSASNKTPNQYIFMDVAVSKKEVYQGEPLSVAFKLYTRANIVDNELVKMPDLTGFWAHDEKTLQGKTEWTTEYVNGIAYNVAILKKTLLIPQKSGLLKIDPFAMNFTIQQPSQRRPRTIFDEFFGTYENVRYNLATPTITIKVKPLPEKTKPKSFSGAVGNFNFHTEISSTKVKANESIDLTITVEGTGNLNLVNPPTLPFPEEFEIYEPEIKDNFEITRNGLKGKRTFHYLIIPRIAGNYSIAPILFSYFHLEKGQYVEQKSDSIFLQIEKNETTNLLSVNPSTSKYELKSSGEDIHYIIDNIFIAPIFFIHSPTFLSLFILILLIPIGGKFIQQYLRKKLADKTGLATRKAERMAEKLLKEAHKHLLSKNYDAFYLAMYKALTKYFSARLAISPGEFSLEKLENSLQSKLNNTETIHQIKNLFNACETARFSPLSSIQAEELYKQSIQWIKNNDALLKK